MKGFGLESARSVAYFFAVLLAIFSWLTPNHYPPWVSFHAEAAMAGAGLIALIAELLSQHSSIKWKMTPLLAATMLAATLPLLQAATGLIRFAGDAYMACSFILAFALAQIWGKMLIARYTLALLFEKASLVFLTAAIACVGLQLYQWLGLVGLGILAVEISPMQAPFANFAQPNHLASLLFLGLVGVLYLYEHRKINFAVMASTALFLQFGLVMTASRTAWLNMAMLVLALWWITQQSQARMSTKGCLFLGMIFVGLLLFWPQLNNLLLLSQGREFSTQTQIGPRPLFWQSMLDAIALHPWFGYGWNQGLVAHSHVVNAHPSGGRLIGNSHNLFLDLLVWNGILLGLIFIGVLIHWFFRSLKNAKTSSQFYLIIAVTGLFVHAMLEYPLSYLYFLLPIGVLMGALDESFNLQEIFWVKRGIVSSLCFASTVFLALVIWDYLKVEKNFQNLRFEIAGIGIESIEDRAPDLLLLNQWGHYLDFARQKVHPGMSTQNLVEMRIVAERFPDIRSLFQTALAHGLNGQPQLAKELFDKMCNFSSQKQCAHQILNWNQMAGYYPQLVSIDIAKSALK